MSTTAALEKYRHAVRLCEQYGLEPMTTLVHFTEPTWFANSGGFANEANVQRFVDYGKFVFANIPGIKKICTINEPAVRAFMGYVYGKYPPHRHNPIVAKRIVENQMKAHVGAYEAIKSMPGGDQVQVGLVHNVLKFRPRHGGFLGWLVSLFTRWATGFTNDLVLDFFARGHIGKFTHTAKKGDFFGINCYGNAVITTGKNATNSFMGAGSLPDQPLSKMLVPYDPTGFSKAIDEVSEKTNLPICFTEFGYGDELGEDKVRQMHMEATLAIIDSKMAAGVPVMGIYPWTVRQGYEWDFNKQGTDRKTWVDLGHFNADGSPRNSVVVYAKYIAMKVKAAAARLKPARSARR